MSNRDSETSRIRKKSTCTSYPRRRQLRLPFLQRLLLADAELLRFFLLLTDLPFADFEIGRAHV